MNILHFYGQTSLAESVMQDGEKAFSSMKVKAGDWQRQLSGIVFLYGQQPNTTIFASIDSEDNEDNKGSEANEDYEDYDDNDNDDNADNIDNADDAHHNPKRR